MAEEQLRTLIEGIRTRLHEELEVQLGAMTDTHKRAVEGAREAAEADAERRWASRIETLQAEWTARLASELASVRAEANGTLAAETARVRAEAQQEVESGRMARQELEQDLAAERQRLEQLLEVERRRAAEAERIPALEAELQGRASELEAQRQRVSTLEAERQSLGDVHAERERMMVEIDRERQTLAAERERSHQETEQARSRLEAERERGAAELAALRHRIAELETEGDRLDRELQRIAADLAAGREQASRELELERQRSAALLTEAQTALTAKAEQVVAFESAPAASSAASALLLDSVRAIDDAGSLTEILAAATRGAAAQAPRAVMFLIHGVELREWPVAGIRSVDSGPLRVSGREAGVIAEALRRLQPATTGGTEGVAAPYFASLAPTALAQAVPLLLGGTPVAVLYADQGTDGSTDDSWQQNVQFLGLHAAARAASLAAVRTAQALRLMAGGEADPQPGTLEDGQDAAHAARRYARLLVSEIKLYNESAVRIGRERRDLLMRLEPEIERARRLYGERVAASVHGRDALFEEELEHTLADGDRSLLGVGRQQQSSY